MRLRTFIHRVVLFAVLACAPLVVPASAQPSLADADSLALIALYDATNGPNWNVPDDPFGGPWVYYGDGSRKPAYDWRGIIENGLFVDRLSVSDWGLNGQLPDGLGGLTMPRYLSIRQNDNLTGPIPEGIGNIKSLLQISLSHNSLSGALPDTLRNLTNLTLLFLHSNEFEGFFFDGIERLTQLSNLNISDNNISGPILPVFGELTSLTRAQLDHNAFEGTLPTSIKNLTNLNTLFLNSNQLTGPLPTEIGDLVSLQYLNIGQNQIDGPLPASIGQLVSLTTFYAAQNVLSGEIPESIRFMSELTNLSLSFNQFEGAVPDEILQATKLEQVGLNSNRFEDIPDLSQLPALTRLRVQDNYLDFNDLLPLKDLIGAIDIFEYLPQKELEIDESNAGGVKTLTFDVGGDETTFKWFRNDVEIAGAEEMSYELPDPNDEAVFRVEARNGNLPGLVLTGNISFKREPVVSILGSEPPIPLFYSLVTATGGGSNVDTRTEEDGTYSFLLEPGTYTLVAEPKPEDEHIRVPVETQVTIENAETPLPDIEMGVVNRVEQTKALATELSAFGNPVFLGFQPPDLLVQPYSDVMSDYAAFADNSPQPPEATPEGLYRLHLTAFAADQMAGSVELLGHEFNTLFIDFIATILSLGDWNGKFTRGFARVFEKFSTVSIRGLTLQVAKLRRFIRRIGGRIGDLLMGMRNRLINALKSLIVSPRDGGAATAGSAIRKTIELWFAHQLVSSNKPEDQLKNIPANFGEEFFRSYYAALTEETLNSAYLTAESFTPENDELNLHQQATFDQVQTSLAATNAISDLIHTSYSANVRDWSGAFGGVLETSATVMTPLLFVPGVGTATLTFQKLLEGLGKFFKKAEEVLKIADFTTAGYRIFVQLPEELDTASAHAFGLPSFQQPAPPAVGKRPSALALSSSRNALLASADELDDALEAIKQHVLADDFDAYLDAVSEALIDADEARDRATTNLEAPFMAAAVATLTADPSSIDAYGQYINQSFIFDENRATLYFDLLGFVFEAATYDDENDPDYVERRDSLFARIDRVSDLNTTLAADLDELITVAETAGTIDGIVVIESVALESGDEAVSTVGSSPYSFDVTATLRNVSDVAVSDVVATLTIPEGMSDLNLATAADQAPGMIPAGESANVEWSITFSGPLDVANVLFSISLASDELSVSDEFRVTLPVVEDVDTDGDGIPDTYETSVGLNPGVANEDTDSDSDGIFDLTEYLIGTHPGLVDSDGDGYSDGAEIDAESNALDRSITPDGRVNVGIERSEETIPGGYTLDQNYPNPFNPTTTIDYTLPAATRVRLVVYDVLGRTVRVLVDAEQEPANYSVRFDAGDLPSGLYLYRLETDTFRTTKKMVVLR